MAIQTAKIPRSPKKSADTKELQLWSEAMARAVESFVADVRTQVNWPVIDTAPTETPERIPCIKLYVNGATRRLYIYYSGAWSYVTLT